MRVYAYLEHGSLDGAGEFRKLGNIKVDFTSQETSSRAVDDEEEAGSLGRLLHSVKICKGDARAGQRALCIPASQERSTPCSTYHVKRGQNSL